MKTLIVKRVLILLTVFILFASAFGYYQNRFSLHFVDEEDNFILGNYLNKNELLYEDLFSHHQPLGYIFSAGIQKITTPDSIYKLVERHREVMIVWGVGWGLLLLLRFRFLVLFFIPVFELSKYYLLGNLFLAESLAVYPLIYLLLKLLEDKDNASKKEVVFLGFNFGLVGFLLAPLWPLLLLIFIVYSFKFFKKKYLKLGLFILGALIWIPLILPFVSIFDYLENTFYINFKYYIPSGEEKVSVISLVESFLAPWMSFVTNVNTPTVWLIRALSILLVINLVFLYKEKKKILVLVMLIVLGMSNLRYFSPGLEFYRGFHLLPWFGILVLINSVCLVFLFEMKKITGKVLIGVMAVFVLVLAVFNSSQSLFKQRDVNNDTYVNYSRQFDIGEAIRAIKGSEDKLFVAPDEWLLYYQADIAHASYMINYYPWMKEVPKLRSSVDLAFENKPTFVYCGCDGLDLEKYLSNYQRLSRHGSVSDLYVIPERLDSLTQEQKNKLSFFGFSY